jgi:hypothetical protein
MVWQHGGMAAMMTTVAASIASLAEGTASRLCRAHGNNLYGYGG